MLMGLADIITSLRILLAPVILVKILQSSHVALLLYIFALFTDVLDGYVARRTGTVSMQGAFLDVCGDFLIVLAGATGFSAVGLFEPWVLGVILFMFLQFIAGFGGRVVYDPFGKSFGVFALVAIPTIMGVPAAASFIKYTLLFLGGASFMGRRIYLTHYGLYYGRVLMGRHIRYVPGVSF